MRYAALMLIMASGLARADGLNLDPWTNEDTYRQTAVTTLLIVDGAQTRWMVRNPNQSNCANSLNGRPCNETKQQRAESNPILGDHPSIGRVNNFIAASILGHAVIAYALPRGWREGWQYVWIVVEAGAVYHNRSVGVKMAF